MFYLFDYITLTENFQISDQEKIKYKNHWSQILL